MKRIIFLTFLCFSYLFPQPLSAQVNQQDSLALVELYNSTGGANWTTNTNWLTSAKLKDWYGVTVSGNRVIWLYLQSNNLTGTLPAAFCELTALTRLYFTSNNLTGNIPQNIGNLSALTDINFYNNNFSGEIPASIGNLTALTDLNIYNNDLSGEIPDTIGNLTAINELNLGYNNLTGSIPVTIGNLSNLEKLYLAENNLSGSLPIEIGNLASLTSLIIFSNNLSGNIPVEIGNLSALENLNLQHNELTGNVPIEIGNLTSLTNLDLGGNYLTGTIPDAIGNLIALRDLYLFENNLTGEIPSAIGNMSELQTLLLSNNNLTESIPTAIKDLPKLYWLDLKGNQFLFSGLEQFAAQNLNFFIYAPQDTVILKKSTVNNTIELSMDAGGTQTTYQWYYNGAEIPGEINNKCTVLPQNDIGNYHYEASNGLLPDLTLYGEFFAPAKKCWEVGQLKFCLNSGTWNEGEEPNHITSTSLISINDFLYFNGTMTIDTLALGVSANGEFFVDNIPLPGGSFGKYVLLEGEQNLTLIGSEGKIMDFLNSGLSKTASLFGASLSIDDLRFFNRQDTVGMKVGCSAHIPWVSESCGTPGIYTPGTDLTIKNLEITNKGIMSAGFEIENIGLFKAGYCLNRITYEHDWKNDIIIAGGDISLPFFADISGGYKLENGKIDSVAWSLEGGDMLPTTPIGVGTLGVSGFYGHISGLNQPGEFSPVNMDVKFGGIFSDVTSDKWYRITADGRTIWPKLFEFSGSGKLLKPIDELPYQIQGDIIASYDVPNKVLNIDYTGNFLSMDEQYWLAEGRGGYTVNHSKSETEVEGYFRGDITLPEISGYWPFNWFNSKTFGTYMQAFNENLKMVHGLLFYYPIPTETSDAMLVKLAFIINTEKGFYESGYIRFPEDSRVDIGISFEVKSGTEDNLVTETFTVPENSEFGVIEIKSITEAPVSSITSPSGDIFSETSIEDRIIYSETEDKKTSFWSLLAPEEGEWQITLENPENNDSIISHFQLKPRGFEFSMNQIGNNINLEWDVAQVDSGQVLNFMFDNDNEDFDGFRVNSIDATLGTTSITLDENYPNCSYYLYAQLYDDLKVTEVYADEKIENYLSTLAPPENFTFEYNEQSGIFDFSWDQSTSPDIDGYILSIADVSGEDSVYAILDSEVENVSLFIENFESKYPKIESYNQEWKIGCPATLPGLLTAVNNRNEIDEPSQKLMVYPNPTNGSCTIRYFIAEPSKCEIMIYDISGRRIAHPFAGFQSAGFHQLDFNYHEIPNGIYLIKFVNNRESFTVKSILNK